MSHQPTEVARFLPVKPVDFMVLMVLDQGERHGYGIVRDISDQTDGRIRLVPGNLYTVLRRLLSEGLLTEGDRVSVDDGDASRRRNYRITPLGRQVLTAEARRLRELVRVAEARDIIDRAEPI